MALSGRYVAEGATGEIQRRARRGDNQPKHQTLKNEAQAAAPRLGGVDARSVDGSSTGLGNDCCGARTVSLSVNHSFKSRQVCVGVYGCAWRVNVCVEVCAGVNRCVLMCAVVFRRMLWCVGVLVWIPTDN